MKTKETTVSRLLKPPDRSFFLFGPRAYHFDGLDVMPVAHFLEQLHQGKVF
jgi:hypothetical protein